MPVRLDVNSVNMGIECAVGRRVRPNVNSVNISVSRTVERHVNSVNIDLADVRCGFRLVLVDAGGEGDGEQQPRCVAHAAHGIEEAVYRVAFVLALAACSDAPVEEAAQQSADAIPDGSVPNLDGAVPDPDAGPGSDAFVEPDPDAGYDLDAAGNLDAAGDLDGGACPLGAPCNPIRIEAFPFEHRGDTRDAPASEIDAYACAPDVNESGGELYYEVTLVDRGVLTVRVDDQPGDDIDVDVHLLESLDPASCRARDNRTVRVMLPAGRYIVVADTWVNGEGRALPGPYTLSADFFRTGDDECATEPVDLRMRWSGCDGSLDCFERDGEFFLRTPAVGPVVKEAHLVTPDDGFGASWPVSGRDGIEAHYARSEAASGYVMDRREPWAPAGEGGSRWGQGSTGRPVPIEDEAWYVNMHWRDRPAPGTRMIVRNPENGRAVVASAGYETGPGANTAVGGATEEIHDWLGTTHRDVLSMGFAADDALPLGPIDCR